MQLDLDRLKTNVKKADTEDLLDRATVYREEMEGHALEVIDAELRRRGMTAAELNDHLEDRHRDMLSPRPDGSVISCSRCRRPAVREARGWLHIFGIVPVFPRQIYLCAKHAAGDAGEQV